MLSTFRNIQKCFTSHDFTLSKDTTHRCEEKIVPKEEGKLRNGGKWEIRYLFFIITSNKNLGNRSMNQDRELPLVKRDISSSVPFKRFLPRTRTAKSLNFIKLALKNNNFISAGCENRSVSPNYTVVAQKHNILNVFSHKSQQQYIYIYAYKAAFTNK